MKLNRYRWALGWLLMNDRITGLARLQAEAAKDLVSTQEGLSVLLSALGFTSRGIANVVEMAEDRARLDLDAAAEDPAER